MRCGLRCAKSKTISAKYLHDYFQQTPFPNMNGCAHELAQANQLRVYCLLL